MNGKPDRRSVSYAGDDTWHVYALLDPTNGAPRYIGSSFNPHTRASAHWSTPVGKMRGWIKGLRRIGAPPKLEILASFNDRESALAHEGFLIHSMKERCVRLLNERSVARHVRSLGSWKNGGCATEGRDLFARFLRQRRMTQIEIAEIMGVRQSSISLWVKGRSRPEHHHRLLLEEFADIPTDAWMTEEDRVALQAARERFRIAGKGAA